MEMEKEKDYAGLENDSLSCRLKPLRKHEHNLAEPLQAKKEIGPLARNCQEQAYVGSSMITAPDGYTIGKRKRM